LTTGFEESGDRSEVLVRIGMGLETNGTLDQIVNRCKRLAESGVRSAWASQIFGYDTLTALAVVGREVPDVQLGTAVIPVHPRHPAILAAQALTVQEASGGRLTLGIGLSHQIVVEGVWGLSFARPARYMREYLSILVPLLAGEQVSFTGELLKTSTLGPLEIPRVDPPPVIVAAMADAMLRIAGEMADGTTTWMTGRSTIEGHIVPTITDAAEKAGRRKPEVIVNLPVCVTEDPDAARQLAAKTFNMYGHLPSYRAMLDKEGVGGPGDIAIVGSEEEVAGQIRGFDGTGATEFSGVLFGTTEQRERTAALLGQLARD
jgi:5,10-methylenetetrahydromethanopterin reductase